MSPSAFPFLSSSLPSSPLPIHSPFPQKSDDFYEGIKARVVEEREPNWKYSSVGEVPTEVIAKFFEPTADEVRLVLLPRSLPFGPDYKTLHVLPDPLMSLVRMSSSPSPLVPILLRSAFSFSLTLSLNWLPATDLFVLTLTHTASTVTRSRPSLPTRPMSTWSSASSTSLSPANSRSDCFLQSPT